MWLGDAYVSRERTSWWITCYNHQLTSSSELDVDVWLGDAYVSRDRAVWWITCHNHQLTSSSALDVDVWLGDAYVSRERACWLITCRKLTSSSVLDVDVWLGDAYVSRDRAKWSTTCHNHQLTSSFVLDLKCDQEMLMFPGTEQSGRPCVIIINWQVHLCWIWCVMGGCLCFQGQSKLVDHLRRSYSTSDLSNDGAHLVQRHRPVDAEEEDELGM